MLAGLIAAGLALGTSPAPGLDARAAGRFARLALECVHREYPNKIAHVLNADADARPPRELTPAFYGCYDWHSSVHGHWLLVRLARTFPDAPFAAPALDAVSRSLTSEKLEAEARYLEGAGRASFERPYGLAWFLQLAAEVAEWNDERARRWSGLLEPLEATAKRRLAEWLPKLSHPIRVGEHDQTAFSFGLILDWARARKDRAMEELLAATARRFYLADRDCPVSWEPSGHDFLSPCLAEADLMRRILEPKRYAAWLAGFMPGIPERQDAAWLTPAVVTDAGDPKLAHLDGLNLSRAWMLEGIAAGLPEADPRLPALRFAASRHRARGLAAVTGERYEGAHWLGSFAAYLVTGRGLR